MLRHRDREEEIDTLPEPDLDPEETHEWPEDAPAQYRVITESVSTDVWREDRSRAGHILMAEWDDVDPREPLRASQAAPGPSVVLRSSPGCYHLWDLLIRPTWDGMVEEAVEVGGDTRWVEQRVDDGQMFLRTAAKLREATRERYKPAPEPVAVHWGDGPVSRPHITKLLQMCGEDSEVAERLGVIEEREETVGHSFATQVYQTMADELAEVW
jgi:hypothetical protein